MAPQPYCLFRTGSETRGQDVARSVGADEDSEHAGVRAWAGSPGWSENRDRHVADDDEPRELVGKEAELSDCVRAYDSNEVDRHPSDAVPPRGVRARHPTKVSARYGDCTSRRYVGGAAPNLTRVAYLDSATRGPPGTAVRETSHGRRRRRRP